MIIYLVSSRFHPQLVGSGTVVFLIADELSRRGHQVTVLTDISIKPQHTGTDYSFNFKYISALEDFCTGKTGFEKSAVDLSKHLRGEKYDVVHVHNYMPMLLVSLFCDLVRAPIFFTFHNTPDQGKRAIGYFPNRPSLDLRLARHILKLQKYEKLILGSRTYYSSALRLGADKSGVRLATYGINQRLFRMRMRDSIDTQDALPQRRDEVVRILLPGRATKNKGLVEAVKAIGLMKGRADVELILTGMVQPFDSKYGKEVKKAIAQVDNKVVIPFRRITADEMPSLFANSDIVLAPVKKPRSSAVII